VLLHCCSSSAIARAAAAIPPELENSRVDVQCSTRLAEPVLGVQVELIDRLLDVTPPSLTRFFFANSGSEVVENAVKLARGHTKRTNVISFDVRLHRRPAEWSLLTSTSCTWCGSSDTLLACPLRMPEALHVAMSEYPDDTARAGWIPWTHIRCDGADNVKSGLPAGLCATHGRGEQREHAEQSGQRCNDVKHMATICRG
jgi:Aminotransferase class-III